MASVLVEQLLAGTPLDGCSDSLGSFDFTANAARSRSPSVSRRLQVETVETQTLHSGSEPLHRRTAHRSTASKWKFTSFENNSKSPPSHSSPSSLNNHNHAKSNTTIKTNFTQTDFPKTKTDFTKTTAKAKLFPKLFTSFQKFDNKKDGFDGANEFQKPDTTPTTVNQDEASGFSDEQAEMIADE
jgi:hypothetical protein